MCNTLMGHDPSLCMKGSEYSKANSDGIMQCSHHSPSDVSGAEDRL